MSSNRQKLINLTQGKTAALYCIDFSVDIRRNITIWRGAELITKPNCPIGAFDWFSRQETPVGKYASFLPEYAKLDKMEKEVAESLTRGELLTAFFDFRKAHPRDGWGVFILNIAIGYDPKRGSDPLCELYAGYEEGMSKDRADEERLFESLQQRNRDYIKELWGVDLSGFPLDFDFFKEWERRYSEYWRKNGFDKTPTDEEIWGRKMP